MSRRQLSTPLWFLSAYWHAHRVRYRARLRTALVDGNWEPWLAFFLQTMLATLLLCLLVWLLYRHSGRIARAVGGTGTTIIVRLSAFLLFCIGIQVLWNGARELLLELLRATA